jgi:tRNA-2-methylthio-N6-dimethylallyladenosine synthase
MSMETAEVPDKRKSLFIKTFGCQMNEYDSQKLITLLQPDYRRVLSPDEADLILVNTCSVREKPEHKLYSLLGEVKELKKGREGVMIGVGGCVAQQEGEAIIKRSKAVDFVFGTHNLSLVPSLVKRCQEGLGPQVAVDYRDEWETLPLDFPEGSMVSAFVSISRGCNKACSYCIVPTTRGKEVSRDPKEIEREVRIAVHRGAREIVLLGQTVNSYGLDFTPRMKFVDLLKRLVEIKGVERIRFTSPHPQEVRQDFMDFVCNEPKVCRHIHMPLQSGSDSILKAMNRNYRRKRYLAIINELKERVPDIAITTDIIVGFPGETREDFEETLEVMRLVNFQNSYSFMFSKRPGTPAEALEETVSLEEKRQRLYELQALQDRLTTGHLAYWQGRTVEVLLDKHSLNNESVFQGRTSQNIVLNLEDVTDGLNLGDIIEVEVTSSGRYTLRGRVVSPVLTAA